MKLLERVVCFFNFMLVFGTIQHPEFEFSIFLPSHHSCDTEANYKLNLSPWIGDEDILFRAQDISLYSCIKQCCNQDKCEKIIFSQAECFGVAVKYKPPKLKRFLNKRSLVKRDIPTQNPALDVKKCEYGLFQCLENEYCYTFNDKRRDGVCRCNPGYTRDIEGKCITNVTSSPNFTSSTHAQNDTTTQGHNTTFTTPKAPTESKPPPIQKLVVSITNKTVELEKGATKYKSATLSAYAIGEQGAGFNFKWTLLNKPESEDGGSISDMNSQTISLINLVPGIYIFKVEVTGDHAYGEAAGNITVIPTRHLNQPPKAVIVPLNQRVTLPNSGVILDGSGSTDDGEIVSYHWELITGPIGYKLSEEDGKTLQLNNLVPGNFTMMLTVKDEAGLTGNATAIVLVDKETDYPPTANAGGDKIIYLPQVETTLNGTASSDDHGITEWEWTKGPEDSGNAVDMQDTRTPYLHLSNLEEGHYHFILKVVDTAGQSGNSSAHVYVHSSADNTPQANAGKNISLVIPVTSAILNGSESTGISPHSHFLWKQIRGPTKVKISSPDQMSTNVSDLTRGEYAFNLTVWNGENTLVNSSSSVWILVTQEKNGIPVAKAGTDFSVTLPVSVVIVNGSESTDDIKVVKWLWERDSTSLAAGNVIKGSDLSPVLLLTDVRPGRYVWNLTVWDDQGASSTDTVSIIVKDGPHHLDEVEIILGIGIESFSMGQLKNLLQKLELLLHSTSDVSLTLNNILGRPLCGETSLILIGNTDGKVMNGQLLVQQLKDKTMVSGNDKILDVPIIDVYTVVCQNNCSGHGNCIQATRECRCQSFWMESLFRKHFGDGYANCDWSVIYVFVGAIGSALGFGLLLWLLVVLVMRKIDNRPFARDRRKKTPRYSLLDNFDTSKAKGRIVNSLLDSASDSDTDNEILFDTRKQKSSKNDKIKNGHIKMQRIRT